MLACEVRDHMVEGTAVDVPDLVDAPGELRRAHQQTAGQRRGAEREPDARPAAGWRLGPRGALPDTREIHEPRDAEQRPEHDEVALE